MAAFSSRDGNRGTLPVPLSLDAVKKLYEDAMRSPGNGICRYVCISPLCRLRAIRWRGKRGGRRWDSKLPSGLPPFLRDTFLSTKIRLFPISPEAGVRWYNTQNSRDPFSPALLQCCRLPCCVLFVRPIPLCVPVRSFGAVRDLAILHSYACIRASYFRRPAPWGSTPQYGHARYARNPAGSAKEYFPPPWIGS